MKPEELMLGDIIKTPKGIRKIEELSNKNYLLDWEDYGCTVEEVEPVSITPEILEKNGFEMKIADYTPNWKMYILTPNFFLEDRLTGCYRVNGNHLAKIEYIHELQHALRLCKIDKEIKL